jgi:hypothetical protein
VGKQIKHGVMMEPKSIDGATLWAGGAAAPATDGVVQDP